MVIGGIIAAIFDMDYNLYGYEMVAVNSIFTAGYLVCIAMFGKQELDTFGLIFYNNILSLPLVFFICIVNGDFQVFLNFEFIADWGFWIVFFVSSTQAFLLNYYMFLCTRLNSALTTTVVGNIKNMLTTVFGYIAFQDVTIAPMNIVGVALGTFAGAVYSWFQFTEDVSRKQHTMTVSNSDDKEALLFPLSNTSTPS
jgi:solute carrier family 35 protein